jgi:hypothetical protein
MTLIPFIKDGQIEMVDTDIDFKLPRYLKEKTYSGKLPKKAKTKQEKYMRNRGLAHVGGTIGAEAGGLPDKEGMRRKKVAMRQINDIDEDISNSRLNTRMKQVLGEEAIAPCVLQSEILRNNPDIDLDTMPVSQLDMLILNTYNRIALSPEVSQRQIFEDVVLGSRSIPPVTLGKSQKDITHFYDEGGPILLAKSDGAKLFDEYNQQIAKLAKKNSVRPEMVKPYKPDPAYEKMRKLEDKIKAKMEAWLSGTEEMIRTMMGKLDLDAMNEVMCKYAEFRRGLGMALQDHRWKTESKVRTSLQKSIPAAVNTMAAFRQFAYEATGEEGFTDQVYQDLEDGIWDHVDEARGEKVPAHLHPTIVNAYKAGHQKGWKSYGKGPKESWKNTWAEIEHQGIHEEQLDMHKPKTPEAAHKMGKKDGHSDAGHYHELGL